MKDTQEVLTAKSSQTRPYKGAAPRKEWVLIMKLCIFGLRIVITKYGKVEKLISDGLIIQAIKVYRDTHRCGLKEARDAVDRMRNK